MEPDHRHVLTCFDWDDTLLSSSWLKEKNLNLKSKKEEIEVYYKELNKLAESVSKILLKSLQHGPVFIVTHADEGWVEQSTSQFIPSIWPILKQVTVISAKTKFPIIYEENKTACKYEAFAVYFQPFMEAHHENVKSILSIGDSHYERDAMEAFGALFVKTNTKTITVLSMSRIHKLTLQLNYIHDRLEEIIKLNTSFKQEIKF
jgi:hypothetical protein